MLLGRAVRWLYMYLQSPQAPRHLNKNQAVFLSLCQLFRNMIDEHPASLPRKQPRRWRCPRPRCEDSALRAWQQQLPVHQPRWKPALPEAWSLQTSHRTSGFWPQGRSKGFCSKIERGTTLSGFANLVPLYVLGQIKNILSVSGSDAKTNGQMVVREPGALLSRNLHLHPSSWRGLYDHLSTQPWIWFCGQASGWDAGQD